MASPMMQDTVVSSTVTSAHSPPYIADNNSQCDTVREQSSNDCPDPRACSLASHQSNSTQYTEDCCSWLADFNRAIRQLAGSTNYQRLKHFLTVYAKNVTKDAFVWNLKLPRLAALKDHISNHLLYYHFHWYDLKEKVSDHYFYLQKMSDILVMYVNLELKLFKTSTASANKVSSILHNALYIYLGNSEEHIFKVLLKSELATKQNNKVCSPIFNKCFTNILANKPQLSSIMFVRYILALKLWKSTSDDQEELKRINNFTLKIMGSAVSSLCFDTLDFFPQPPKKCINQSMWYLQTKSFDLPRTIDDFLQFEENSHSIDQLDLIKGNEKCCHLQITEVSPLESTKNNRAKAQKQYSMKKRKLTKGGEVILIDLTDETDYKNSQKNLRMKQNLKWLKNVKKKKTVSECSNCEIADSTNTHECPFTDEPYVSLPMTPEEIHESNNTNSRHDSSCNNYKYEPTSPRRTKTRDASLPYYNDIPILSNSNGIIFESPDITKDKSSVDLFDDYICDMSIDSNLLINIDASSHLSETELLSSDLNAEFTKDLVSSSLDFNLNGIDSDFSYSTCEAIDPCLTRKTCKDTCSSSEIVNKSYEKSRFPKDSLPMPFRNSKNQLLTELTDFGLYEVKDENSFSFDEDSRITSTDISSGSFIFGLNADMEIADFTKSSPMDEYSFIAEGKEYAVSSVDGRHWKKKILKTSGGTSLKSKRKVKDRFDEDFKLPDENKKKRRRSKRAAAAASTLKIRDAPSRKMKTDELFNLDEVQGSSSKQVRESNEKFLNQNVSLQNEKLNGFIEVSSFRNLADYIQNKDVFNIITLFDSGNSIVKKSTPKNTKTSYSDYFIRLLYKKGLLLRHYTQNENLERLAGIPSEKCVALPGNDHDLPDLLCSQIKCDCLQANLLLFFTNNSSLVCKWLKGKCSKLFIIQEKTRKIQEEIDSVTNFLNPILKLPEDLRCDKNLEVIQAETFDKGCQLLVEKLGWLEELKKLEGKV